MSRSKIRNIGIIAHIDAGKTTTTERILYDTGTEHRLGNVDDGNTVTDWMKEEQERGITITSAAVTCEWQGYTISIIDTPGHVDFTAEVERSLRVLDGAVGVFDARHGVQAQSETVWRQADRYGVPRIAYINKMDVVGADFDRAVQSMRDRLKATPVPIQIPYLVDDQFAGILDLINRELITTTVDREGGKTIHKNPVPEDEVDRVEAAREKLLESLADVSDVLAERFLGGETIGNDLIWETLRVGTIKQTFTPTLCGSSFRNIGIQPLLDAVVHLLPSPDDLPPIKGTNPKKETEESRAPDDKEPFCALAFKTFVTKHKELTYLRVYSGKVSKGEQVLNTRKNTKVRLTQMSRMYAMKETSLETAFAGDIVTCSGLQNTDTGDTLCSIGKPILLEGMMFPHTVVSMNIEPKTTADKDKLLDVLKTIGREDPTFQFRNNEETGQLVISGMGELHLDVIKNRMLSDFNVNANVGEPSVAYKETMVGSRSGEGDFHLKRENSELFAKVRVTLEHDPNVDGVKVINRCAPDTIPKLFHLAIEQTLKSAVETGGTHGFPVIQVRAYLDGGEFVEGQSTEPAYQAATNHAVRDILEAAGTLLLEPIMSIVIETPNDYYGNVQKDLISRRGNITDVQSEGDMTRVYGEVPVAETFGYASAVRSISQGRADHSLEPKTYQQAPKDVQERYTY